MTPEAEFADQQQWAIRMLERNPSFFDTATRGPGVGNQRDEQPVLDDADYFAKRDRDDEYARDLWDGNHLEQSPETGFFPHDA
jgi:hypothetical protein